MKQYSNPARKSSTKQRTPRAGYLAVLEVDSDLINLMFRAVLEYFQQGYGIESTAEKMDARVEWVKAIYEKLSELGYYYNGKWNNEPQKHRGIVKGDLT